LVTDYHNIVAKWRKHFPQLFNVHGVSDVRQRKIHTAEPLVPEPSGFEFEVNKKKKDLLRRRYAQDVQGQVIKIVPLTSLNIYLHSGTSETGVN
jgi:hypothetical protein